jgi:hypothetical protein
MLSQALLTAVHVATTTWSPRPYQPWVAKESFCVLGMDPNSSFYRVVAPIPIPSSPTSAFEQVLENRSRLEMEASLVAELEKSGMGFKLAGMTNNAKVAWSLAAEFYSTRFDDEGMRHAHTELSQLTTTTIPLVDNHFDNPTMANATGVSLNPTSHQHSEVSTRERRAKEYTRVGVR